MCVGTAGNGDNAIYKYTYENGATITKIILPIAFRLILAPPYFVEMALGCWIPIELVGDILELSHHSPCWLLSGHRVRILLVSIPYPIVSVMF